MRAAIFQGHNCEMDSSDCTWLERINSRHNAKESETPVCPGEFVISGKMFHVLIACLNSFARLPVKCQASEDVTFAFNCSACFVTDSQNEVFE